MAKGAIFGKSPEGDRAGGEAPGMGDYHRSIKEALSDPFLRGALERFYLHSKASRPQAFKGLRLESLTKAVRESKEAALSGLEGLYDRFRERAESKGAVVHRCGDAASCRQLILAIAKDNGVSAIVKSKSMTAEEIALNPALEAAGISVSETDLGEWIVQLRGEGPSHMVLPAIHLSKDEVALTFEESRVIGGPQGARPPAEGAAVEALVRAARLALRPRFQEAHMGVTGANFALADSGTIGICTNEGNGRLCATLPGVHVALLGLDKLLPGLADAANLLRVLPRNATAQDITTYVSLISGAADCQASPTGKKKLHIVFLDNGRTGILKDPACRELLYCVRCGACANVCPVYRMVGGHRMGHVYIGAVGLGLTYFLHGAAAARNLAWNCIGCGACKEVCVAGIDLPSIVFEVRARLREAEGTPMADRLLSLVLPNRTLFGAALKVARIAQGPFGGPGPVRHLPIALSGDRGFRALPLLADKAFRDSFREAGPPPVAAAPDPSLDAAIFAGCAHDYLLPEELWDAAGVAAHKGASISFPMGQVCCGLPALTLGLRGAAVRAALANIEVFGAEDGPSRVLTLCASCASHIRHAYQRLVGGEGEETRAKAARFAGRITDFATYAKDVLRLGPRDFDRSPERAAYHSPCHMSKGLGVTQAPRELIGLAAEYLPTPEEELCCGFGGSFSLKFPEESAAILSRKLGILEAAGAHTVVSDCPGCVVQLRGGEEKRGRLLRVEHLATLLARRLKAKG
ncbi:MAG: LUD domain-containing protein [Deltaproteobacteria bacterium]|jgi:iron-sulfur cluster protein|nr:LUD domain-containing protein [Deltaproteobacteria bacterium]